MIKANKIAKTRPVSKTEGERLVKRIWDYREMYLMLIPSLIYVFIFSYIPMYGIIIGFQDMKLGDVYGQSTWVGLDHIKRFFEGIWIETLLRNTLILTAIGALLGIPLNLGLALLLHNSTNKHIKKLVQSITYVPNLLSLVLIIGILNLFVDREGGLINIVRQLMGYPKFDFYASVDAFLPMYILSGIWQGTGAGAIIYIGALAGVDEEMVEAARIDGASKLRIIWNIQLPSIKPTLVTMMIMNFGHVFAVGADKILLMQSPLNVDISEVISTYIYQSGIVQARYSFSTAVGLFQNVCNIIMLAIVNFVADKFTGMGIM